MALRPHLRASPRDPGLQGVTSLHLQVPRRVGRREVSKTREEIEKNRSNTKTATGRRSQVLNISSMKEGIVHWRDRSRETLHVKLLQGKRERIPSEAGKTHHLVEIETETVQERVGSEEPTAPTISRTGRDTGQGALEKTSGEEETTQEIACLGKTATTGAERIIEEEMIEEEMMATEIIGTGMVGVEKDWTGEVMEAAALLIVTHSEEIEKNVVIIIRGTAVGLVKDLIILGVALLILFVPPSPLP